MDIILFSNFCMDPQFVSYSLCSIFQGDLSYYWGSLLQLDFETLGRESFNLFFSKDLVAGILATPFHPESEDVLHLIICFFFSQAAKPNVLFLYQRA